jgi:hypothetical protein
MARKSNGPWWWEARQQWYATIKGKQITLGKDEAEARKQWHILEATAQTQTAGDSNLFIALADSFLEWTQRHHKRKTFIVYRSHLEAMSKAHPLIGVAESPGACRDTASRCTGSCRPKGKGTPRHDWQSRDGQRGAA